MIRISKQKLVRFLPFDEFVGWPLRYLIVQNKQISEIDAAPAAIDFKLWGGESD